ncbi:hypothetical protein [Thermopirellula anaerolimosa]
MNGKEILLFFVIFASWFALNRWVLPWLGIPTCMSGSCSTGCSLPPNYLSTEPPETADDELKSEEEATSTNRAAKTVPAGAQSGLPYR